MSYILPTVSDSIEYNLLILHGKISEHFRRAEPRERALSYMLGLAGISEEQRLGRRTVAGDTGRSRSDGTQRLLTTAHWDDVEVRRRLREIVRQSVPARGTLCVVEATFRKKGDRAVAVQHQFSVESGRRVNCQNAVLLLLVTPDGSQFLIDVTLYVPSAWTASPERLAKSGAPVTLPYRTKSQIAADMIAGALDDGFVAQQAYLALTRVDEPTIGPVLRERRLPYLALSVAPGDPGDRDPVAGRSSSWFSRQVTVRPAGVRDDGTVYHAGAGHPLSNADLARGMNELRAIEHRWRLTSNQVRLGWYETRSWRGWYRHMTLAMAVQIADQLTHSA